MTFPERDPFGWVRTDLPPRDYTPTWITQRSYLIPMRDGAVLCWVYDEDGTDSYCLLVRLTEVEAERVFAADPGTGMLEAVRKDLYWRGGLINVKNEDGFTVRGWRYVIQGDTSEEEFVADMMSPPADIFRQAVRTPEQIRDQVFADSMLVGANVGS